MCRKGGTPIQITLMPEAATSVAACSTEQIMLEIVHDRSKTSEGLQYCDLESKWENYHIIITLPG